jgi:DEAD/DEAH box helicase domain-containing protein
LEQDLPRLENLLIDCELIIGFNHRKFDLPVLQRYLKLDTTRLPMLDLMEHITETLGHRVSLESVAQATLGVGKTGHGLDAIDYFQRGEWEKLKSYCLNDVKLTKEIYEYGMHNGHVLYLTRDGLDRKSLRVQWGDQEKPTSTSSPAAQYNLGF